MRKFSVILLTMAALLLTVSVMALAQDKAEAKADAKAETTHEYVGPAKCKMCHMDIFKAWEQTPHAKAYSALSAEEQKNADCVKCHITGKTADGELIENVTCEACHGPGSDYKSIKIMNKKKWEANPEEQLKLAKEAGLVLPTAETCTSACHHEEGNPNFKPFDFDKMAPKVHPVKSEG